MNYGGHFCLWSEFLLSYQVADITAAITSVALRLPFQYFIEIHSLYFDSSSELL
jgi:hypothetical protein